MRLVANTQTSYMVLEKKWCYEHIVILDRYTNEIKISHKNKVLRMHAADPKSPVLVPFNVTTSDFLKVHALFAVITRDKPKIHIYMIHGIRAYRSSSANTKMYFTEKLPEGLPSIR